MEGACCLHYAVTGACQRRDQCSGDHEPPVVSTTLLLPHAYQRPEGVDAEGQPVDPRRIQQHFEDFYEYIYKELCNFGEIEYLIVCDDLAEHMIMNVFVQFKVYHQADDELEALEEGWSHDGRPIMASLSPLRNLRDITCRKDSCDRGRYCKSLHAKEIEQELRRRLGLV